MAGRKERQTRMAPGYRRVSFMSWATVPQKAATTGSADILSALGERPYRLDTE